MVRISSLQFILSICVSTSFSLSLFIIIAAPFIAERCGGGKGGGHNASSNAGTKEVYSEL